MAQATATQKKTVMEVYDPAMCCSTGVCGPDVDDALVDFANDVKWLKANGIDVKRFNLGQEPEAFKMNVEVVTRLQKEGTDSLPIILVNGNVVSEGGYPDRDGLKNMLDMDLLKEEQELVDENVLVMNDQIRELVALSAALASNCESCLKFHYKKAKDLGISKEIMAETLQIAQNVKQVPAGNMVDLSNKLLGVPQQTNAGGCAPGSGCC